MEFDLHKVFYLKSLEILPVNVLRRQLQGSPRMCVPSVLLRELIRSPVDGSARRQPTVALEVRSPSQHGSHCLLGRQMPQPYVHKCLSLCD